MPDFIQGEAPGYDEYGASNAGATAVGTASVLVLRPNARRSSVLLVNDSASIMYLAKGRPAVLNVGIRLNANGGSYEDPDSRGRVWKGAWYAITTAAAQNIAWTEDW